MAGKLTPAAQARINELYELGKRVQHIHGLVEQFATAKEGHERFNQPLKRAFGQLKMALMGASLDAMAQVAAGLEIAAGRGSSQKTKSRILRDGVDAMIETNAKYNYIRDQQLGYKDGKVPLMPGERPERIMCRMRSLGCSPCTGAIRSTADTVPKIIEELIATKNSERQLRIIDHDQDGSMELKKREGYF